MLLNEATNIATKSFEDAQRVTGCLAGHVIVQTAEIAQRIVEVIRGGGTIFVFGNGGSAADAQHFVGSS